MPAPFDAGRSWVSRGCPGGVPGARNCQHAGCGVRIWLHAADVQAGARKSNEMAVDRMTQRRTVKGSRQCTA